MVTRVTGLRVAMFGTPAFAVPTSGSAARLASRRRWCHHAAGPAARTRSARLGRPGQGGWPSTTTLTILQPDDCAQNTSRRDFDSLHADLAVVAAYGKMLPAWLLAKPRLGFINVHASLLPKYRGASPVHRAVMAGDAETGVTIMRVVQALDAGPMLAQRSLTIGPDDTTAEIEAALARLGAVLAVETIDRLTVSSIIETPQDDSLATLCAKTDESGWFDRLVKDGSRAAQPHPRIDAVAAGLLVSERLTLDSPPLDGRRTWLFGIR